MFLDKEKVIETVLYVVNEMPGLSFMQIFKIMYFAEQDHLVKHGRMITGDDYVAMANGPVPSHTYAALKAVKGVNSWVNVAGLKARIEIQDSYHVYPMGSADTDFLSPTDIECLDASIRMYGVCTAGELSMLSHGPAWSSTERNRRMKVADIAAEAEASEEQIKYLEEKEQLKVSLRDAAAK